MSGGPGSFTGLRIGSATAKGLGLALKKPLIHVPTLDAMAYQHYGTDRVICPMLDARRGQVYAGIYQFHDEFEILMPQTPLAIGEVLDKLGEISCPVVFLGDGVPVSREAIERDCPVPYVIAPSFGARARAGAVAALGAVYYREGKTETAAEHGPEYLRLSQAERNRMEKGQP